MKKNLLINWQSLTKVLILLGWMICFGTSSFAQVCPVNINTLYPEVLPLSAGVYYQQPSNYITDVSYDSIQNTTDSDCGGACPATGKSTTVIAGSVHTIKVSFNYTTAISSSDQTSVQVWFDWNQNGFFDAGEGTSIQRFSGGGSATATWSNVPVPTGAVIGGSGATMRVAIRYDYDGLNSDPDPCGYGGFTNIDDVEGDYEDYTINVIACPTTTPVVTSLTKNQLVDGSIVTLKGSSFFAVTAVKFNGVDAASFTVNSSSSITAVAPSGLTAGNVTVTTCNSTTAVSTANSYTVIPPPNCLPTVYSEPGDYLKFVGFGDLYNDMGAPGDLNRNYTASPSSNYTYNSVTSGNIVAGSKLSINFTYNADWVNTCECGPIGYAAGVYIDANDNGDFEASEVWDWGILDVYGSDSYSKEIQIPSNMPVGSHRLRIVMRDTTGGKILDPCSLIAGDYADYNDYLITIINGCSGPDLVTDGSFNSGLKNFTDYDGYNFLIANWVNGVGNSMITNQSAGNFNDDWWGGYNSIDQFNGNRYGGHGGGNYLMINGIDAESFPATYTTARPWCQTVNLNKGEGYVFSYHIANLINTNLGADVPQVVTTINGVQQCATASLSETRPNQWKEFNVAYTATVTQPVEFCIAGLGLLATGDDFGLDDISIRTCKIGELEKISSYCVPQNPVVTIDSVMVTCPGGNDGKIEFHNAQWGFTRTYEYSIDGGATWSSSGNYTLYGSPAVGKDTAYIFTGLAEGTYHLKVRDKNNPSVETDVNTAFVLKAKAGSVGGTAKSSVAVCSGINSGVLNLVGHTGSVVKWQSSTDPTFSTSVTDIVNITTNQNFTNLTTTTYYRAVVQNGTCVSANSVPVTITVNPLPSVVINTPAGVCIPATVDLTAAAVTAGSTAGLGYTYFTDVALTTTLASPNAVAASGTYYIKGLQAATGCFSAKSVVVTVGTIPSVITNNPSAVCSPATVDLTAGAVTAGSTGGLTYTYFTNAGLTVALASPNAVNASGTYYIKGTTGAGCFNSASVTVIINNNPTVITTNPTAVCSPATVDLTAGAVTAGSTGGLTYTYFTNAALTTSLVNPNAVSTSGTYYIKGTTGAGCFNSASVVAIINNNPTVITNNPLAVCSPATVDLTAGAVTAGSTGGLTYTYFTNAALTTSLVNPNAVATSGTYYIKGTTGSGCFNSASVVAIINNNPTVVTTNPLAVCSPAIVDLTAGAVTAGSTGGLTYTYFTNAALTTSLVNPNAVATSGTYYIKGTTGSGCFNSASVVAIINNNPTVITNNPLAVCSPATVDLTAGPITAGSTGGLTYTYFTNAGLTVALASPNAVTTSGTYYIKGTTGSGCFNSASVVAIINNNPTVVTTNPTAVCSPATVDLTAGAVTAGSTGGLTYSYFTNAALTTSLVNPNAVSTSGTYYIKGTTGSGCFNSASVVAIINNNPTVITNNPVAVCSPATVDLTAGAVTAGSTGGLTYTYFTNAALTTSLVNPNAVATSGTYYIKGTTGSGCFNSASVVAIINNNPTVVTTNPTAVCSPATVDLTAGAVTAGSTGGLTYSYFTNAGLTVALASPNAVTTSGTYYIKGTTGSGCFSSASVVAIINNNPTVITNNPLAVCSPATVDLTAGAVTAGSTGGLTYTYFTNAGLTVALASPNAVTTSGTYYIKGTTGSGCFNSASVVAIINNNPTVVTTNPLAVCSPATVDLTAGAVTAGSTGGLTYTYFTNAGLTVALASPNAVTTSGTYYIKGTTGSGCFNSASVVAIINNNPTVVTTNPLAVCSLATVDLTAGPITAGSTGSLTYSYFANAGLTVALASPNVVATSGTYYIKGTTGSGCFNSASVVVTVNAQPIFSISKTDAVTCTGTGSATVTISASLGNYDIDLNGDGTYEYLNQVPVSNIVTLSSLSVGTVINNVKIRSVITGCVSAVDPINTSITAPSAPTNTTSSTSMCADGVSTKTLVGSPLGGLWSLASGSTAGIGTISGSTFIVGSVSGTAIIRYTSGGCNADVAITINGVPTLVTTNPSAVCSPAIVDLTAAGVTAGSTAGLTYTYFTNAGLTVALASPNAVATSGTYYIKGTTAASCTNSASVVVTVNTQPTVTTTAPSAVCSPAIVDLTAAGVTAGSTAGLTYSYFTNAGLTVALASPNAVTSSGTYYIKGTTAASCTNSASVVVTVNAQPTVATTNPSAVCSPSTVDLTAAGVTAGSTAGLTYTYFTNVGLTVALASPNAVTTSGTYYIKGTTAASCTNSASVVVTVNAQPTVATTNPSTVCSPSTVDLTAGAVTSGSTGGLTYTYFTNAALSTTLASPSAVASSGTYYIKGTTASGCTNAASVVVTINTPPNVVTTNPTAVCSPSTVDLTAGAVTSGSTGGLTYTYFTNAALSTTLASPSAVASSGTYYIKGTTAAGCINSASVVVTVNAQPIFSITKTDAVICTGKGSATITITSAIGNYDIDLNGDGTYEYLNQTPVSNVITLSNLSVGTVLNNVKIRMVSTGCESAVDPINTSITAPSAPSNTTSSISICADGVSTRTLTGAPSGGVWSLASGSTTSIGTITGSTFTVGSVSGTAIIRYTFGGCDADVAITINAKPIVVTTNPTAVCSPATVDITQTTAGITYTYFTDAAASSTLAIPTAVASSGTYYVVGVTSSGCSDTASVVATVNTKPVVTTINPSAVCSPATVDITQTTAGITYTYFTDIAATTTVVSPTSVGAGTYYVVGVTSSGCSDTASVVATVNTKPVVTTINPSAVCSPSTVDITQVTAGITYSYFTDAGATSSLATPSAVTTSGTYYVVGATVSGCSDTASVVATVNTKPVLTMVNPSAVCAPATVDITQTTAGITYSYFTNAAATATLASPSAVASSGIYYVVGVTSSGCSDTASVVATINTTPVVTTTNPSAVCSPATVDITQTTAGITYSYFTDAGATSSLITASAVASSGTYYVVGLTSSGCSDTASIVATINTTPVVTIINPSAVCSPATVDITQTTAGITYTYFTDAAASSTLATPTAIASSGTYYVVGTTSSGCSDTASVVATVNTPVTAGVGASINACITSSTNISLFSLLTGANAGGVWTETSITPASSGVDLIAGTFAPNGNVSGVYKFKYSLTGVSPCANDDEEEVSITLNNTVTAGVGTSQTVCEGDASTINLFGLLTGADAGGTWSETSQTPATSGVNLASGSFVANSNLSGMYTFKYTLLPSGTCLGDTEVVNVVVNPEPTITIANPTAVCSPATIDITQTTAGIVYSYFTNAAATSILASPSAVASSGTYYVVGVTSSGCSDTASVVVTVNNSLTLSLTNPTAVCAPATVDITQNTAGVTYSYYSDSTAKTSLTTPVAVASSGTYYVVGTTASGCSDTASVVVTINTKPVVITKNPSAVCSPSTVDITQTTAGITYSYFTDATAATILATPTTVASSGTYYVVGTITSGCSDTASVVVTINTKPLVQITNPPVVAFPTTIDLTDTLWIAGSSKGLRWSYFTDPTGLLTLLRPTKVNVSGIYYIKAEDTLTTCSDIKPIEVKITSFLRAVISGGGKPGSEIKINLSGKKLYPVTVVYTYTDANSQQVLSSNEVTMTDSVLTFNTQGIGEYKLYSVKDADGVVGTMSGIAKIVPSMLPTASIQSEGNYIGSKITISIDPDGTTGPWEVILLLDTIEYLKFIQTAKDTSIFAIDPGVYKVRSVAGNRTGNGVVEILIKDYVPTSEVIDTSAVFVWNAVSPDGDGKNDKLIVQIPKWFKENNITFSLFIFDREGTFLKKFHNVSVDGLGLTIEGTMYEYQWDCKNEDGNILTPGTYFYSVKINGGSESQKKRANTSGFIELRR